MELFEVLMQDLTLICLMLLDAIPGLKIEGADYLDMELLAGSQYEHLMLDDLGSAPQLQPGTVTEKAAAS